MGGGFRIGNSCTPVVDSCQCMAKPIQYCKVKKKKIKKKKVLREVSTSSYFLDEIQPFVKKKKKLFLEYLTPDSP